MYLKSKKGISLITLIITIIIILILTTIVMTTTSSIPDEAHYAKYVQEFKNIQTGVDNQKVKNSRLGNTEEALNNGFDKVYLENEPENFKSFGDITQQTYGYMVDLETIDYNASIYGKGFEKYSSGDTLKFGEDFDVFVYDANWTVFYVKGLNYDGSMNYSVD